MLLRRVCAAVLLCLLSTAGARAATLPAPTVDYSATRVIETADNRFTQRVWSAAGGRERAEMVMDDMAMIMIMRPDRQLAWMVMPAMFMYQEMSLEQAGAQAQGTPPPDVEISEEGPETIAGLPTTKYKMIMKDRSAGGFIWLTADGIPLRMDMLSKDGGKTTRVNMHLENLVVAPQDAALFELPAGVNKMPSMGAGMAGLFGAE